MEKQTSSLALLRQTLKGHIYHARRISGYPICPICGESFQKSEPSMHEVFVPRSVVRGCAEETQLYIFVPQNVVLVHEGDCHIRAQHFHPSKVCCAMQILVHEGEQSIVAWMDLIDSKMKTRDNQKRMILEEAIERLKETENIE